MIDKNKANKVIFPCSADPITNGHVELVGRASTLFHEVRLVVLNNPWKQYLFALEERMNLCKKVVHHWPNVFVDSHEGLLADYAYSRNIPLVLRGIRNNQDLEFEKQLQQGNREQWNNLETIYLLPHRHPLVSSGFVKSIIRDQGEIDSFVPLIVKQALEEKMLGQVKIGVTGSIACGKTTVTQSLAKHLNAKGKSTTYIDLDALVHKIYRFSKSKKHLWAKEQLMKLGREFFKKNGDLDREKLSESIYQHRDKDTLSRLTAILEKPLDFELRQKIKNKKGLILIEGTVLLEQGGHALTNNNFLFITCPREQQINRLMSRGGLTNKQAKNKIELAGSIDKKMCLHEELISTTRHGGHVVFDNDGELTKKSIEDLYQSFKHQFARDSLLSCEFWKDD